MITSLSLSLLLTVLFVGTGLYALARWSAVVAARLTPARRLSELSHLLMSAAMVLMVWSWPGTAGLSVQLVLFGGFALGFAVDAVRRYRHRLHGCAGGSAHALMTAAMVWMLAAMPLIMPMPAASSGASGGHAGHAGHEGMAGMPGAEHVHGGPAGWAVAVTLALVVGLVVATAFWAVRAAGAAAHHGHEHDEDVPGVPLDCHGGPADAAGAAPTAVAQRPAATGLASRLGPRSDAACHTVMGAGTALMLVAMVVGW
ncbi:DUF5134 domain-containing protein [Pseudonocardia phyllosphaerae]|uniref:DUF5134 domain-containing protein n=1 Tax=Pseudonocardia phyllosphaerae TaxID=3390502 RepID=UPI00397C3FB4